MSRQLVGLQHWLAQRRRRPREPRLLLWPVDRSVQPTAVVRQLEASLRARGTPATLQVAGPAIRRDPAASLGTFDPFGAADLEGSHAVIIAAASRRSSVLHAYRIFKELVALSRRPLYCLVLSGRSAGLQVELFGRRVRELATRHTGVAWHLLGTLPDGRSEGDLKGLPVLEELLMVQQRGGHLEVD